MSTRQKPRLRLRRSCGLALCLFFGVICFVQPFTRPAAAAEAVAPSQEHEMSMTEMKRILRERAVALADFGGVPGNLTEWTTKEANQAVEGTLYFDNDIWVKTGLKDIDWTGGQYNHIEWTHTLLRFGYVVPLASAYRATHDERYAQAARAYIEDYMRADKGWADRRARGDNTLCHAIRLDKWTLVLPALLDSPSFDDEFVQKVVNSIAAQAWDLSHHLTSGNFRLLELNALVFTALRLPFVEHAKELLDIGIRGMRANLASQFLPDGVHVERTPSYHAGIARNAIKYAMLAKKFPEADAHVNPDLLAKALDYSTQSALSGFNDSVAVHRDPTDMKDAELRVRTLKKLFPGQEINPFPPLEQVFPYAGHVFVRSAWKPGADYLAFDAGTWGGGHCHLNRLSFTFRAAGRELVADPGSLDYDWQNPLGPYGRSTPAHSTLNINGYNQSDIDAQLLRTEFTPATVFIQGRYQGAYWAGRYTWGFGLTHGPGMFGRHNRALLWIKGEYLLALDSMLADADVPVHNVWQMGPMVGWGKDESKLTWWSKNKDTNLFLQLVPFTDKVQMECFEGSKEPLRGWVGKHWYGGIPAPQVEFRYLCIDGSIASATLLVPFAGEQKPTYTVKRTGTAGGLMGGETLYEVELGLPDGSTDLIAWTPSLETSIEDMPSTLTTDGTLIWLRLDSAGKPVKGFVLDGSFIKYKGQELYESDKREEKLFAVAP